MVVGDGGHLGLKGTVTLSLSRRGARLNTSYSTTKTGCGVHTNEPIIGGFYHSIPSWFNLPNKHSLFPCVRVGWSVASRAWACTSVSHIRALHLIQPFASEAHLFTSACAFLEVSLRLLSSTHFLLLPLQLSAKILCKAKKSPLPVCMTRWRWYVKQEAIRADYSDSSSWKKKEHSTKDGKRALLLCNHSW